MKKHAIVAALAAVAGGSAVAQSNVEIYGRMNMTIERQKAGGQSSSAMVNNASRIGFRGVEDLGGGLKAGFTLEHGFNADTGAQSQPAFWARQSEVNLGGSWGMVRLGNFTSEAYYATADYVSMHNHDTGTSSDALYAYLGRNRDKVAYRAPSIGGVTFEAAVTQRDLPGDTNRTIDLAANYDAGPLHLGAGYEKNGDANQFALRALYEMGPLTVGGYLQRDKNAFAANAGNRTNVRLAASYVVGVNEFHANLGRAGKSGNVADSSATQWTLGYNHNLSKRTKVYAFYTKLSDSAAGLYGGDFSSLAAGIRHNF